MKTAVIAVTERGAGIALRLRESLGSDIYLPEKLIKAGSPGTYPIEGDFIEFVHGIFPKYRGLIFVTATGIAVRSIAGALKGKRLDPAVVVLDERARFAISLVSGHLGGANDLAKAVAKATGAVPVITTASDLAGIETPDVTAAKLGLYIENFEGLKRVSSCLLRGDKVAYVLESGYPVDAIERRHFEQNAVICDRVPRDAAAAVFITDKRVNPPGIPHVILRPRSLVLGIGARKGAKYPELLRLLSEALDQLNLSVTGIGRIATVDLKREEESINELSRSLKVPVEFYTVKRLQEVENRFPLSEFVKQRIGVGSVARPSAFLASNGGEELGYFRGGGFTLAIFRRRMK
ncbi:cobalt-precorrin 5A hydrolase [Thermosediminibacter oceani]|uniref:Cobalamin (Vitamin B12) biosynthesis CbiG protein n=1 Tax=Thermosediminibacter oceani (strain ATCC BAA-1034 / DSM 16646 / JW/IW-1228P) TaxID=555079 RepID=D9S0T3_THEOJ|nr:cobalt-precorrin 5A hydrolase [Thermosediminibacter oceani]ADL07097.1 cobalamin (vitamin B12) biosynthesis CbiG protein [Thermosediminibacter oceani DSM 16646]